MKYLIRDLETKVKELKSNQSTQLIQKIENLLRDIKGKQVIPDDVKADLSNVLAQLNHNYNTNIWSNIPFLVLDIIDKLNASSCRKINSGYIAAEGHRTMRQNIENRNSVFNLYKNFGFNLWHK